MKKYRRLPAWTLNVPPKNEYEFEGLGEVILTPNVGNPFLHWYTPKGNLSATTTLNEHMLISTPVRVVNGSDQIMLVEVIEL